MELWRLLAHRNWFTLRAFGIEVRLCSRCSGYMTGFLLLTALRNIIDIRAFQILHIQHQFLFYLLFTTPLVLDWLTQSWGLRESDNATRFITGTILGIAVSIYSVTGFMSDSKILLFVLIVLAVALIGLIGLKTRKFRR